MNGWFTEEEKQQALKVALASSCPACHARPGEPCTSLLDAEVTRRRPVPWPHVRRFNIHSLKKMSINP
jgi:hypothetical protein